MQPKIPFGCKWKSVLPISQLAPSTQLYHKKYDRTGHLFQDRYRSEVINDDSYLLQAVRYVLKNPQKAGIGRAEDFEWSSYSDYTGESKLTDTQELLSIAGGTEGFRLFMQEESDFMLKEPESGAYLSEKQAKQIFIKVSNDLNVTDFGLLNKEQQIEWIRELTKQGLSVRQVSALIGINKNRVQRLK